MAKKQNTTDDEHFDKVKDLLEQIQANIKQALDLLREKPIDTEALLESLEAARRASQPHTVPSGNERIIEGVFNGDKMVSAEGVEYNIPPNYASKSKLVEGDLLKLTIAENGSFIYKQIGPIERKQLVATLTRNEETGEWYAIHNKNKWRLLTAAVTYYHGGVGDEVVILVPEEDESTWAAVENVIKSS